MTYEQAFLKIKEKFASTDAKKLDEDFAIQVNMTDPDCGGAFYIKAEEGKLFVEPYDYRDNTADVTLKKLDLYKILDGKLSVEAAIESGKLYVNGNAGHFAKAGSAIVKNEKKAETVKKPVKKSAPKAAKKAEKVKSK